MKAGEYPVSVIHRHNGRSKAIALTAIVQVPEPYWATPPQWPADYFVWLENNYPDVNVDSQKGWFGFYSVNFIPDGTPNNRVFLCEEWELNIAKMGYPFFSSIYYLRKRNQYSAEIIIEETKGIFETAE
jgi:hypothetical protein